MSSKKLKDFYDEYIEDRLSGQKMISIAGFKKFIMIEKKESIKKLHKISSWQGIKGDLEVLYEDYLVNKIDEGGRHSQNYSQLLNKLYEKQSKKMDEEKSVNISIDFKNEGKNKI